MGLSINDTAPDFEADTTQGRVSFHEWIGDSWAVLKDKDRLRYEDFLHVIDGKTTGAARASLSLVTTFADVYRFWQFAGRFRDVPADCGRRREL